MISHCGLGHENFELLNHDVVEPVLIEGGCNTPKGALIKGLQYVDFKVDVLVFIKYMTKLQENKWAEFLNVLSSHEDCAVAQW